MIEYETHKQIILSILVGDFREGHTGRRWLILYDLLGIGLIVAGWWIHPLAALGALLLFTVYDINGYEGVEGTEEWMRSPQASQWFRAYLSIDTTAAWSILYRRLLCSYRVIQTKFQLLLIAFIATVFDIRVAAAWLVAWWFGGEDILYYLVGRYELPSWWLWLSWTPFGILSRIHEALSEYRLLCIIEAIQPAELRMGKWRSLRRAWRESVSAPLSRGAVIMQAIIGVLVAAVVLYC